MKKNRTKLNAFDIYKDNLSRTGDPFITSKQTFRRPDPVVVNGKFNAEMYYSKELWEEILDAFVNRFSHTYTEHSLFQPIVDALFKESKAQNSIEVYASMKDKVLLLTFPLEEIPTIEVHLVKDDKEEISLLLEVSHPSLDALKARGHHPFEYLDLAYRERIVNFFQDMTNDGKKLMFYFKVLLERLESKYM